MNPYAANSATGTEMVRVVAHLAENLVEEIDAWGVPSGCKSRADAIRRLLKSGLKFEAAAGGDLGGQAPAAEGNSTALERGESINNGKRSADDECASA